MTDIARPDRIVAPTDGGGGGGKATSFTFSSPGIQSTFTIDTAGTYDITARGAPGGGSTEHGLAGGAAAAVGGDIYLQAGTQLEIVVGGAGRGAVFGGGGGGGGAQGAPGQGGASPMMPAT